MVKPKKVKVGLAPTRRVIFSVEDALKCKVEIEAQLREWEIEFVNINSINKEGLLVQRTDVPKALDLFRREGVNCLFIPHVNFGTEDAVARLARDLGKPTLLWGPRDESPLPDGSRLRDTQCGLFATSEILRRMSVPFSYIVNSRVDSEVFERGMKNFVAATAAAGAFRCARIGQVSTRPTAFWTMIVNEGELLERWGIEVVPVTLTEILLRAEDKIRNASKDIEKEVAWIRKNFQVAKVAAKQVGKIAGLKLALAEWAEEAGVAAIALQCWSALQSAFGIFPCFVHSLITDAGVPVTCETDIHGALATVMAHAAVGGTTSPFFADLTVRHPDDEDVELLWHCGQFPPSLAVEGKPAQGQPAPGWPRRTARSAWPSGRSRAARSTICRFDGDPGSTRCSSATARGQRALHARHLRLGPGFGNWPLWEERIIRGPYVHHVVGIHGHIAPALYEACRFLGIQADCVEPTEAEIQGYLRGE